MYVIIAFLVVVTVLQQYSTNVSVSTTSSWLLPYYNNILQTYLYPPPPPGNDYKQYKVGWDQAQSDAYYDADNGKYRDYLSGPDCQGHTEAYCHEYMAGYQDYVDRNSHHLVDQQNVAENNTNNRTDSNNKV